LRHFAAILSSGSRRHLLADLDLPAVVMHGTADPLIPVAAGRATAKAIAGARFVEFPHMGHVLPRELYDPMVSEIARNAKVSR
jgi:pimeloyl-ACP methyl ester carboxylesterase